MADTSEVLVSPEADVSLEVNATRYLRVEPATQEPRFHDASIGWSLGTGRSGMKNGHQESTLGVAGGRFLFASANSPRNKDDTSPETCFDVVNVRGPDLSRCPVSTPDRIRTYNPRFRRPMRYPVAPRARVYLDSETPDAAAGTVAAQRGWLATASPLSLEPAAGADFCLAHPLRGDFELKARSAIAYSGDQ